VLGLLNAVVQTTVLNEKQQKGMTTEFEEAAMVGCNELCYHSLGGSKENEQLSEQWIYSACEIRYRGLQNMNRMSPAIA
jgi:hypothetical protein